MSKKTMYCVTGDYGIMFAEFDFEVIGNIYENPKLLESKEER